VSLALSLEGEGQSFHHLRVMAVLGLDPRIIPAIHVFAAATTAPTDHPSLQGRVARVA
jgi:hypothetical protein